VAPDSNVMTYDAQGFSFSAERSDWLWGPPSLQHNR